MAESSQAMLERSMRSVFVGNIPFDLTEEKLKEIFSEVGPVLSFKLVYDRENGKPKGYGFCEYKDIETGNSAMRNLNGFEIGGRILKVDNAANEKTRLEMQNANGISEDLLQAQEAAAKEENNFEHVDAEQAPEAISKAVASLPPEQMFELMKQMKQCVQNNPAEARTMLLQNPQLAYALLQAQVVMRIVDPQVAVNMLHKANIMPEHQPPDSKLLQHPHQPQPPIIRPEFLGGPHQMDMSERPMDPRMARMGNAPMDTDLRIPMPVPPVMPPLPNQHYAPPQPDMMMRDPRQGPGPMPVAPPRDPRGMGAPSMPPNMNPNMNPMGGMGPMGPGGPGMDPRSGGGMDPRSGVGVSPVQPPFPRQMAPAPAPVPAPNAAARAAATMSPNLGNAVSDQEKAALIMQVLQLSDEQIAMLPPEQRQSILVLKEQIAKSAQR